MYAGRVLTTDKYLWPCRLCHTALKLSLIWIATVSVILRHSRCAPGSLRAQVKQIVSSNISRKINHTYPPQTELHSHPLMDISLAKRFQVVLCLDVAVTQGEISGVALKKGLENQWDSSMVIVPHGVVHLGAADCFSLHWCQLYTKGYYYYRGWRNVKHLIFFFLPANVCGNQHSVAVFCGGIYWGLAINTGPTRWLGS